MIASSQVTNAQLPQTWNTCDHDHTLQVHIWSMFEKMEDIFILKP